MSDITFTEMSVPADTPAAGQIVVTARAGIIYAKDANGVETPLSGGVVNSRTITAGDGLVGGGDLSTDRSLAVGPAPDNSIVVAADSIRVGQLATDAQHGNRGGGAQHAVASTSQNGFMSAGDKTALNAAGTGVAANQATITGHINAANGAHAATAISYVDSSAAPQLGAAQIQAAIDEIKRFIVPRIFEFSEAVATNSTTTFNTKMTTATVTLEPGEYELSVGYGWSRDNTGDNFESRLQVDIDGAGFAAIGFDPMHEQEPKDVAGTFSTTGTDQKHGFHRVRKLIVAAEATYAFRLQWRGETGGESSLWDAMIKVQRTA